MSVGSHTARIGGSTLRFNRLADRARRADPFHEKEHTVKPDELEQALTLLLQAEPSLPDASPARQP